MGNSVDVKIEWPDEANNLLQDLPSVDRLLEVKAALKKAAKIVERRAKELCPKPGYPGDKKDKKPLRDTIGTVVRTYSKAIVVVVGPQHPAGAHGHLVEFGHEKVLWGVRMPGETVAAKPFMRPAADETRSEQESAIIGHLKAVIEKPRLVA
jgi:HK97 gp10 family phage protein